MTETIRRPPGALYKGMKSANLDVWRHEFSRQLEIALKIAKNYEVDAKAR